MKENLCFLLDQIGADRITVRVPDIPDYNCAEDREKSLKELRALGVTKFDLFDYVIRADMRREQ